MARRTRTIVHHHGPPAPPAAPAPAPAPASPDALSWLMRLAAAAVFAVGAVTLLLPWVRQAAQRLPPAGVVCWDVMRSTAAGSERSARCEPAPGWHAEQSPSAGVVVVPNDAEPVRRRSVRD